MTRLEESYSGYDVTEEKLMYRLTSTTICGTLTQINFRTTTFPSYKILRLIHDEWALERNKVQQIVGKKGDHVLLVSDARTKQVNSL